jgi:predicted transcriptional regulator
MTTTGIKLDEETRKRLQDLATAKDRSVHWLMKEAIGRYLAEEERFEREKAEDEARYQRFLDTGAHHSNEEMHAWFDELATQAQQRAEPE